MDLSVLRRFGLSDNEIEIYLFLLKEGTSTVPQIANVIHIDKATIYRVMSLLVRKGLVSEVVVSKVRNYSASDPSVLVESVDILKDELSELVPQLNELSSHKSERSEVELYVGSQAIKMLLQSLVSGTKEYWLMGHSQTFYDEMELFIDVLVKRVEYYKVKGKVLISKGEMFRAAETEEVRYLPEELSSLISTIVFDDKVMQIIMTRPYHALLIKDSEVARAQKKLFMHIWEKAEKAEL